MSEIFVFGSNLAGRHGKGAAAFAAKHYRAEYGVGEGPTGQAYAIPTKDANLSPLPLDAIEPKIRDFLEYARGNPKFSFHLTPVGTGLAGHKKRDIWAILQKYGVPDNVVLTASWINE